MTAFLRIEANDRGPMGDQGNTGLTIWDATNPNATKYNVIDGGADMWGGVAWDHQFSGMRGTQGARPSPGTPKNRLLRIPLRVTGSSKDDLALQIKNVQAVLDLMRRYGGRITRKASSQSYRQHYEVLVADAVQIDEWSKRTAEVNNVARIGIAAVCSPYALGDPMEILEAWGKDTINGGFASFYTADLSNLTDLSVTANKVIPIVGTSAATERRIIHTGYGYNYGDVQALLRFTPGTTISSFKAGVVLKRLDESNYLEVYVDDNGANSRLRIDKVVATVRTNLATTNLGARVILGQSAVVVGRIEGNVVYAEHWLTGTPYHPADTPTTTTSFTLTTTERPQFGTARTGKVGLSWTPQSTNASLQAFWIQPFVYARGTAPETFILRGGIPGDAPALGQVRIARTTSDFTSFATKFEACGWYPVPWIENRVTNGHFDSSVSGTTGWSVAAVTGVTGAATSINRDTTAARIKYGTGDGVIVTPATANTGASYAIYRRFRKGIPYIAFLWASSAAGVTNTRLRLGVNGDIGSETASALTTTPTFRTVTWTPAATVDQAYLAFEVTAATGTTMNIDGVCVVEGIPATLSASISSTTATTCTVTEIPEEWGPAPFGLLIDTEVVVVRSITPSTLTLTIERGAEGTTAATHSSGAEVFPVPNPAGTPAFYANEFQGGGCFPPYGIVQDDPGLTGAQGGWTVQSDANGANGFLLKQTTVSVSTYFVSWLLNPSLVPPPDYSPQMLQTEILARMLLSGDDPATTSLSQSNGYSVEYGTSGKSLRMPTAGNNSKYRLFRFGTFNIPVQSASFLPVFTYGTTGGQPFGLDYCILLPAADRFIGTTSKTGVGTRPQWWAIDSDLQVLSTASALEINGGMTTYPYGSAGGSLIEFPVGSCAATLIISRYTPEDSSLTSETEPLFTNTSVQFVVTPRWNVIREA